MILTNLRGIAMRLIFIVGSVIWLLAVMVVCSRETSTSSSSSLSDADEVATAMTVKTPTRSLLTAVDQERVEIVQQHMDAGTDPDEYSRPVGLTMMTLKNLGADGAYSIHLAVLKENEDMVRILLDNGGTVDIRAKNEKNPTSLHLAAYYCLEDMVSLLIEYGASIDALDSDNAGAGDYALLGQQVGIDMIEEKKEQESDPSKITSSVFGSDQLVPGCLGKTEGANTESQVKITEKMDEEAMLAAEKRLDNLLAILE